jgi:PPOX class probable FMN-dependent enzyme
MAACSDIGGTEVKDLNQLRHIMGAPMTSAYTKIRYQLDDVHKRWMAASPMVFLATASARGNCDVSPRGDPSGAVLVLDDSTIAIADRPGNRRAVSLEHIVSNPHAGLLFVVPGRGETLRVNGRAVLVRNPGFAHLISVDGLKPELAIVIDIEEIYLHCTKSFARSGLWDPTTWDKGNPASPRNANGDSNGSRADMSRALDPRPEPAEQVGRRAAAKRWRLKKRRPLDRVPPELAEDTRIDEEPVRPRYPQRLSY